VSRSTPALRQRFSQVRGSVRSAVMSSNWPFFASALNNRQLPP
jgi:hypothetical protein